MKQLLIFTLVLLLSQFQDAHAKTKKLSSSRISQQIAALEVRPKKTKKDYLAIAELYGKLKKFDKAISNLKLANKPQSIEVLDELSRMYNRMGDDLEEARALELIRVEDKASPSQLTRLGFAYQRLKKTEDALKAFRESVAKAPKYEKAYQGIFEIHKEAKNFYDARLIIIEVLEKFGEKKYWLNEFCRIEIEQNYYGSAKKFCHKAISKDPKNPDNHVYLALSFKHTENEDQARKIIFKAAKQFKKSEVTQWNAGQMSCAIKNWEQGSTQFKQCVKIDASSGRCHLGLGKTLFELKKYEPALTALMKACPYLKGIDVEIRRLSYELEKFSEKKMAKKYNNSTDKCSSQWFEYAKKNKSTPTFSRHDDACFVQ